MTTLYWCPQTRAVRALWMVEELGIPVTLERIDIRDEAAKADPEFRKASPMGKVPAIRDNDVYLSDGAAICLYLADRYPEKKLAPALGDSLRASYYYWMTFVPGVLEPAMAEKFAGWETSRFSHGWGDFDTMIAVLEDGIRQREADGPWLLGAHFSAADIMVGSSANFMKIFGILPPNPVIESYIGRCLERPAYKRALAADTQ